MVSFGEYFNQTGEWKHYCGGAIIADNVVLSAAHCFFQKGFGHGYNRLTLIRTGDQNFSDPNDDEYVGFYEISSIIKHPDYRGFGARDDLAMVYTKSRINFNARTNLIGTFFIKLQLGYFFLLTSIFLALPPMDNPIMEPNTNYSAKFVGYGYFDDTLTASEALRAADFTIFEGSYCEQLFAHSQIKHHLLNTSVLMCAGTDVRHNLS